jgi:hypothetical protein
MKPTKLLLNDPRAFLTKLLLRLNLICHPDRFDGLVRLFTASNDGRFKSQNIIKNLEFLVSARHLPDDLVTWYLVHLAFGNAVTQKKLEHFYGPSEGLKRWDTYRQKQSLTNKFEYKQEKNGMNLDDFASYNRSRSVTLKNQIFKYGVTDGTSRFEAYRLKQQSAGNTLDYFVEKFGQTVGISEYKRVCSEKGHTMDNFVRKYGSEIGPIKFIEVISKMNNFYSKASQNFINLLEAELPQLKAKSYYATKAGEYMVWSKVENRAYFYDYVNTEYNICIEYNGDHYHANPKIYAPNKIPTKRKPWVSTPQTALELWDADKRKIMALKEERGIRTITIWESDFLEDPENLIQKIIHELNI